MFGIGMPEMLVLLAVALIVFGPKKLPELAKSLGRALGEFKRATSDLKDTIETETGMDEVRNTLDDVKEDIKSQVDLAADVPDPTAPRSKSTPDDAPDEPSDNADVASDDASADPSEDADAASDDASDDPSEDADAASDETSDDPLDKVKSAFDEMNSAPHESQPAPRDDQDPEHQDTTKK